jgi:hypothetical protein
MVALRADGVLRGFAKVIRDFTERRRLEEAVRQAQETGPGGSGRVAGISGKLGPGAGSVTGDRNTYPLLHHRRQGV